MIAHSRLALSPGSRIRVLVVDDSVVIRRLVAQALDGDPQIEVVGSAANGAIALQRIPQLNPHVVTLDIEMPEMDGIQTLKEIRKLYPSLFVIMFSSLTEVGAVATLDALCAGANDYVAKSSAADSLDGAMTALRGELVPKIKQFFHLDRISATPAPAKVSNSPVKAKSAWRPRQAVVIGVSTGGPNALAAMMPMLPANFPLPILIVQHMPPVFTRLLAERLAKQSSLRVEEAAEGTVLEPGKALIASGNYHLRVRRDGKRVVAALDQEAPENSCRPSVDVLFRSAAEIYGGGVVAVILTGMGSDGARGVRTLREMGAYVIAQDEASSVVWGMPGAVVQAGLADSVVDLNCVAPEILNQI